MTISLQIATIYLIPYLKNFLMSSSSSYNNIDLIPYLNNFLMSSLSSYHTIDLIPYLKNFQSFDIIKKY